MNSDYRPWLIFQIEEGFKGDLISRYRNDYTAMDEYLSNIYNSLKVLETKFKVAVLIYPVQFYDRNAYGILDAGPLDNIHPGLRHALGFFESKIARGEGKIRCFIEMYSSGIATEQNGELSIMQPPPLYNGGNDERWGMPMDLDTIAELKRAYPNSVAGIRFHEIYGSDLVMKLTGMHAFILDPDIVSGCIDLCKDEKMILYWTDSNWLINISESSTRRYINDKEYKPYFTSEPYKSLQEKAISSLGKNVIFSYANNNYHLTNNLERLSDKVGEARDKSVPSIVDEPVDFITRKGNKQIDEYLHFDLPYDEHPLKKFKGASWGISDQSWFWSEMIFTIGGKKYYPFNDDDCPPEIIAAFAFKAFKEKADAVQFEPAWYFFNTGNPHHQGRYGYEKAADFTARTNLRRFIAMIMQSENSMHIMDDPNGYFDDDMQKLIENSEADLPKLFSQNSLVLYGKKHDMIQVFDFYNNGSRWITAQPYRYPQTWNDTNTVCLGRAALNGNGEDVIFAVRDKNDGYETTFCRQNGVIISLNKGFPAIDDGESFVSLISSNLISESVGDADPDELILITKSVADGKLDLRVYTLEYDSSKYNGIEIREVYESERDEVRILKDAFDEVGSASFKSICSVRRNALLYKDKTRDSDRIVIIESDRRIIKAMVLDIQIKNEPDTLKNIYKIEDDSNKILYGATLSCDIDNDRADELLIPKLDGNIVEWNCYKVDDSGICLIEKYRDRYSNCLSEISSAAGMRKTVMNHGIRERSIYEV